MAAAGARRCVLLWTCVAIAAMSVCAAYKYDTLAHSQNTEVSASVGHKREYYSERYQYHKWSASKANGTKSRSENGTLKIINIVPYAHHNQREDSSRVEPTALQTSVQTAVNRDSIVFPGEQPRIVRPQFVPAVTDECKQGDTICLNVPNYPEEYINSLLSNSAEEWTSSVDQLYQQVKINQRIGQDPDTFELCDFEETISYPKAAQNKDNRWLTIINTPSHVQGFKVEVCRTNNSKCHPAATFRLGMVASCKQKHVLRQMRALDANGNLITDNFRIPSCCSCFVRYVDG